MADVTMPGTDVIRKQLVDADRDLPRELVSGVAAALMDVDAEAVWAPGTASAALIG